MNCPKCCTTMHKAGFVWSGSNHVQRWRCPKCGATTSKKQDKAEPPKPQLLSECNGVWSETSN